MNPEAQPIIDILKKEGFDLKKMDSGTGGDWFKVIGEGYAVGSIFPYLFPSKEAVEINYLFHGANYGSMEMARGASRLRKALDKNNTPYVENPTREEFKKHERSLIMGLEKRIAEARERIKLVGEIENETI